MSTLGRRPPRRREDQIREVALGRARAVTGMTGAGLTEGITQPGAVTAAETAAILEIKGPWQRDQVTLSMEAKLLLLELRASAKLDLTDLAYANSITILELRSGIYVRIEPTGCYRLCWRPN